MTFFFFFFSFWTCGSTIKIFKDNLLNSKWIILDSVIHAPLKAFTHQLFYLFSSAYLIIYSQVLFLCKGLSFRFTHAHFFNNVMKRQQTILQQNIWPYHRMLKIQNIYENLSISTVIKYDNNLK